VSGQRVTKAELLEQLAVQTQKAAWAAKSSAVLATAEAVLATAPDDAEALAIARCVKALDALPKRKTAQYSNAELVTDTARVKRVLDYLAARFGVLP
jgi:hypothetical protein